MGLSIMPADYTIIALTPKDFDEIIIVWEESVKATHHFLMPEEIDFYKPYVLKYALPDNQLFGIKNQQNELMAFMGLSADKIEMLFVHPKHFKQGFGKKLINFAKNEFNIKKVDVNEDNPQALAFYKKQGFHIVGRSELDGNGKPHPILSMEA